jgi:hypothetical protein
VCRTPRSTCRSFTESGAAKESLCGQWQAGLPDKCVQQVGPQLEVDEFPDDVVPSLLGVVGRQVRPPPPDVADAILCVPWPLPAATRLTVPSGYSEGGRYAGRSQRRSAKTTRAGYPRRAAGPVRCRVLSGSAARSSRRWDGGLDLLGRPLRPSEPSCSGGAALDSSRRAAGAGRRCTPAGVPYVTPGMAARLSIQVHVVGGRQQVCPTSHLGWPAAGLSAQGSCKRARGGGVHRRAVFWCFRPVKTSVLDRTRLAALLASAPAAG